MACIEFSTHNKTIAFQYKCPIYVNAVLY